MRVGLSTAAKIMPRVAIANKSRQRVFLCLEDLLTYYQKNAPRRAAILAPGYVPVTYAELRARVEDAVRALRSLGIHRSDRVAVVLPNGPEAAVAIIAVATAAICVPLNPSFAADEWHRYFATLRVAALVTRPDIGSASRHVAHALGIPVIDLSPRSSGGTGAFDLLGSGTRRMVSNESAAGAENDAFILLTSGTTLRPKLVPLTHASICQSAYNAGSILGLGSRDRLLNVLPLFHAHGLISGLLTALAAGSTVVCTPGFDADRFFSWLTEFRPTWYTAVPTIHRALLSAADRYKDSLRRCSLRLIRSASATLPRDVLGQLESVFGVPVVETYGMTEAASQIAANPLRRRKPGSVGRSAGAEIAIMNPEGRRLSAGVHGEIVLRGPTITRGYDADIDATEAAFRHGWFRTGDLGYLDRDGYLFIVARIREIIKRGGQQVAPAEVEEVLLSHPAVAEAAAFSVPHTRLGEDVAVAVVLHRGVKVSAHKLRTFARERLADYKVPGLIRIVPEIPKSPAGKINRGALATALSITIPASPAERDDKCVPPRTRLQRQLAKIWADLLKVDRIGVNQDILALGADSLVVTQMLSRLRERFGASLSFKDIFDHPTIAGLAARIESSKTQLAAESQSAGHRQINKRAVRLSFQQQRIYVLSRLDPTRYNYHVVDIARLSGRLNFAALESSIAAICQRHEVLRSTFRERRGEPVQIAGTAVPRLERVDLAPCDKRRRAVAIRQQSQILLRQSMDIAKDLPLRPQLLRLDEDDHALVIKLQHLVTDGWSQRVFWEELEALYTAKVNGTLEKLAEPPIQYRHFVERQRAWLRTPAAAEQLNYWRAQLKGLTELPLRTDRPRPDIWTGHGARYPLKLSRTLSAGVRSLSRDHGVTVFMTLLAAFQCLLYRYTEHDDVAVGSLIAGRNQTEVERIIGMFANTIILRTDLSGDPTFSELLQRVRQVTLDAYRNQDLPIEKVLQALKAPRCLGRNALFQVMFVLQNALPNDPSLPHLSVRMLDVNPGIARFDLTLELMDVDERLSGWLEYSTDLFEAATIARMSTHLRTLLEAIVANPKERVSRLTLLPAKERKKLICDWNDTGASFDRLATFSKRFAIEVKRAPHAPAVSSVVARLSYRELERRSSAIAHRLSVEGVAPDAVVLLLAKRDVDLLAAMIGVERTGGAFHSLDPALPAARLAHVIKCSSAALVLVGQGCSADLDKALHELPTALRPKVLRLEELGRAKPLSPLRHDRSSPSSLAYVIYTSGSTGIPKGAMIERRGLYNHLFSQISDLKLSASDVIAQTAPQSFVISVWQFLAPLMVGARVHICADEVVRDPSLLAQEIARESVTILQIVPSLLRHILDQMPEQPTFRVLSRLRCLISTGEPLSTDLCRDWFRHFPDVPLMNAYGSAECSDDVATHRLTAPPTALAAAPIGRPIANMRLYVLDRHLAPVPIGVAGQLYVGGVGVGRGYLNDPRQTGCSFLENPFIGDGRERLYRTGDLARWRADGTLECLGRIDHQVKIRGYRIDPGEIEHLLAGHRDVQAATVLARDDGGGDTRLVAYVVAAPRAQPKVNELRDFLKARVPAFMIPVGFIFLQRMPLTAHGKVDRSSLVAMRQGLRVAGSEFVAPRNATEEGLTTIWTDLLKVKDIGVLSNFFDMGGHSLLAGQVLARVANEFGTLLPIRTLFEAPTINALAQRIDQALKLPSRETRPEFVCVEEAGPCPVSIMQEEALWIDRLLPGLPQFNLTFAYRLGGPLNRSALERALVELMRRHDSLRTAFAWVGERAMAMITPASEVSSPLAIEDLAAEAPAGHARAKALLLKKTQFRVEQEAWTPFDTKRAPLFRTRLFRLGTDDHVLLLVLHHMIADGWSIQIFFEELSKLYASFGIGRRARLPQPALQFSDVARWQRWWCKTHSADRQVAYWTDRLRAASPLFPRVANQKPRFASPIAREPQQLPNGLVTRLGTLARREGATLFMALLTGFKVMLLARTGRNDICIATVMANRTQQCFERIIGPLENTTLIRTRVDTDLSFLETLARVRDAVLEAHAHQELPFDHLACRLAEDGLDPASFIQVFFVLQNAFDQQLKLRNLGAQSFGSFYQEVEPPLPVDRTCLTVMLKEGPSGINGSWSCKQDLFKANTLRRWIADYKWILAKAAANPEMSLSRLASR